MLLVSFRWFASRVVPGRHPRKQAVLAATLLLTAGCGGGMPKERTVSGQGYRYAASASWQIERSGHEVQAHSGTDLVSVTTFALQRRFRPQLWDKVVTELDRAAEGVAQQQQGKVSSRKTVTIAGRRARRYDIEYQREGKQLVERIAFVLEGRTEYLLLCRYAPGGDTRACDRLAATFRLT
jgi:hypothetical protein